MQASNTATVRADTGTMSRHAYVRAICLMTLIMSVILGFGSVISMHWGFSWMLLIGTFIGTIAGIALFVTSDDATVSFCGVALMSVSLGLMIGPVIMHYSEEVVLQAVMITIVMMGVMSVLGMIFPQFFGGMGSLLFAGLTLLIVAQFAQIIFISVGFAEAAHMPILAWLGIAIFLGYTAYDWADALGKPHTWNNAIDTSGGLVLDFANLLLRVLEIMSDD